MWKMESLNKGIKNFQFQCNSKTFFFAKLIYNLQVWNMEPMKFAMAKFKKKLAKEEMKKLSPT
jgi:hypothetical protein